MIFIIVQNHLFYWINDSLHLFQEQIYKNKNLNWIIDNGLCYRKCDVADHGGGVDGFSPKLSAKNNVFNYIYPWDNSDNGRDAYDKEGDVTNSIIITHSAYWKKWKYWYLYWKIWLW